MRHQKKYFVLLVAIVLTHFCVAQNLVPNHSFEKAWTCPQFYTTDPVKELVPDWKNPNKGTPDYYHLCSDSIMGVPENFAGYAYPLKGSGYIGLILRETFDTCTQRSGVSREYVQAKLTEPLMKEQLYCVRLNYMLASRSLFAVDALGITITRNKIAAKDAGQIIQKPQVTNIPGHIMDNNTEWVELSGTYRARGGEQYFSIGNFWDNDLTRFVRITDTTLCDTNFVYAYYFIDDVWLYPINSEYDCICPNEFTVGSDWLSENYDPNTGYNSLNLKNSYDLYKNTENLLADNKGNNSGDGSDDDLANKNGNNSGDGSDDDLANKNGNNSDDGSDDDLANKNGNNSGDGSDDDLANKNGNNSGDGSDDDLANKNGNNSGDGSDDDLSNKNGNNSDDGSDDDLANKNGNNSGDEIDENYNDSDSNIKGHLLSSEISESAFMNAGIGDSFRLNRIFFEFNSSELLAASFSELDTLANIMINSAKLRIEIRGHTDNIGTERYNKKLSVERAASVYNYLISKGIDKSRMKYRGFGTQVPIADNETDEGRRLNRRVEIIIVEL
jgi:outer membrane protein OmpA-like peptidoglycan-associated protein